MQFRSKHHYPMLYYMLTHSEFAQRHMAKDLGIHFGQTVNGFVHRLIDLGVVSQTGSTLKGARKYEVISPTSLISFYSKFRKMPKLGTTFRVGNSKEEMMNYLSKRGVIFCLTTALSYYSKYYVDPTIHAYVPENKYSILEELRQLPEGKIEVNLYKYDLEDEVITQDNKKITSKIRTIIDLFCDNKANTTDQLIKDLW